MATYIVDHTREFLDVALKDAMSGWVSDHSACDVLLVLRELFFDVFDVDFTLFIT